MRQDLADHALVVGHRNDPHLSPTPGTHQGVDLVHPVDQLRPGGAGGLADWPFFLRDYGGCRSGLVLLMLAPVAAAVGAVIANQVLVLVRDMLDEQLQPLDTGHHLEVALERGVHLGFTKTVDLLKQIPRTHIRG